MIGLVDREAELGDLAELDESFDLVTELLTFLLKFFTEVVGILQAADADDGVVEFAFDNDVCDRDETKFLVLLVFIEDTA